MTSVLVVDDDAGIRRLVRLILTSAGYEVFEAENGEVALDRLHDETPAVLLLDLNMPVMNGWELFERLEADHTRPLTIIISSSRSARVCAELGAEASLPKPFGPDELVEKVGELAGAA